MELLTWFELGPLCGSSLPLVPWPNYSGIGTGPPAIKPIQSNPNHDYQNPNHDYQDKHKMIKVTIP